MRFVAYPIRLGSELIPPHAEETRAGQPALTHRFRPHVLEPIQIRHLGDGGVRHGRKIARTTPRLRAKRHRVRRLARPETHPSLRFPRSREGRPETVSVRARGDRHLWRTGPGRATSRGSNQGDAAVETIAGRGRTKPIIIGPIVEFFVLSPRVVLVFVSVDGECFEFPFDVFVVVSTSLGGGELRSRSGAAHAHQPSDGAIVPRALHRGLKRGRLRGSTTVRDAARVRIRDDRREPVPRRVVRLPVVPLLRVKLHRQVVLLRLAPIVRRRRRGHPRVSSERGWRGASPRLRGRHRARVRATVVRLRQRPLVVLFAVVRATRFAKKARLRRRLGLVLVFGILVVARGSSRGDESFGRTGGDDETRGSHVVLELPGEESRARFQLEETRAFHSRAFDGRFSRVLVRVEVHATRGLLVPVRRLETARAGTSNVVRATRGNPSDGSVPFAPGSAHSPRVRRARTRTVLLAIEEYPGDEGAPSRHVRASRAEEVASSAEEGADGAQGPQFSRDGLDEFFHRDDGRDVRRRVAEHRRDVRERLHGEAADEFHERGVEHLPRATVRVVGFLRLAEHRHRLGLAHEVGHHLEVDEEHQKLILVERGVQANYRPPVDLLRRRAEHMERGVVAVHATQRDVPRRHLVHGLAREQLVQIPIMRDSRPSAPRENVISQQRRVRAGLVLRLRVPNRRRATKRDAKLVKVESKIREPSPGRLASIAPIFILHPRAHAPGVHRREESVHVRRRHRVIEYPSVANQSLPSDGGDLVDAVLVVGDGAEHRRATKTTLLGEASVLAVRAVHVHQFGLEVFEVVRGIGVAHLTKPLGAFLLATRDGLLLLAQLAIDGGVDGAGLAADDLRLVHVLGVAAPVDVLGVATGTVQLPVHLDGVVELRGREGRGERRDDAGR